MKKLMMLSVLALSSLTTLAADYDYLVVQAIDGQQTVFVSEALTLTFVEGATLTVTPASGTATTLTLTQLAKMYFSADPSSVNTLNLDRDNSPVTVYNAEGRIVGRFSSASESLGQLSRGLYVMKSKNITRKVVVQ